MIFLFVAVGAVLGIWLLDGVGGFVFGGVVGFLVETVSKLRRRVRQMEAAGTGTEAGVGPAPPVGPPAGAKAPRPAPPPIPRYDVPAPGIPVPSEPESRPPADPPTPRPPVPRAAAPAAVGSPVRVDAPVAHRGPPTGAGSRLLDLIRTWATTGNVPVKLGVLLSLIGLGFLLGVALEQGWITLTIEVRHLLAALFGVTLLVVGGWLRGRNAVYGLSLQGGGIAVLYLTTYVAHSAYDLLPAPVAAATVVAVTVGAGVLAVLEDARSLAVLGIIGGFLAPILAYSGAGDHVVVFGFYVILSAAVVAVARFKTWPELDLLGLGFTLGVSLFWLLERYDPADWSTTQPLIALLVLMYMAIPLLVASRRPVVLKDRTISPLVFGLPFVALGFQAIVADHFERGPAISALVLALVHGCLALVARRSGKAARPLADVYPALGMAFLAIAVPLAFDALYISVAWALQGSLLVWIGVRRTAPGGVVLLTILGGVLLQGMSAIAFVVHLVEYLPYPDGTAPVANGYLLGAALLAVNALFTARVLETREDLPGAVEYLPWAAFFWGIGWWLGGGVVEIVGQVGPDDRLSWSIGFVTISLGGMALLGPTLRWPRMAIAGILLAPALGLALVRALVFQEHPFEGTGWPAWIMALSVYYTVLRVRGGAWPKAAAGMHTAGYWIVVALLATEVHWWIGRAASGVWPVTGALAAVLAVLAGTLMAPSVAWPFGTYRKAYLVACAGPVILVAAIVALVLVLISDGDATPLIHLPLLNPLEVVAVLVAIVALSWGRRVRALERVGTDRPFESLVGGSWLPVLAIIGAVFLAMAVARTVHHWLGVPFDAGSMFPSTALQASLSIVWGLAGLTGMVIGVRLARRTVWVCGASLMGVVVVKLFLIDLSNTGTVERVVSFLGVGVLLLVIGYFAPVPPSASARTGEVDASPDRPGTG